MKQRVYLETTVVSYLTARPTRDLVVDARQALTRNWWRKARSRFDLYVSALVVREAAAGDRYAASKRLLAIDGIPSLLIKAEVTPLAKRFVDEKAIPVAAMEDAIHIALATVHGMDYLLTWNFAHIANAALRQRISDIASYDGFRCPVICTPEELGGET